MYDALGRIQQTIDRLGRGTIHYYDAAGREIQTLWRSPNGNETNRKSFSYDAAGNMLTASDNNGAYTFTFDALNRIATQKDMWGTTLTMTFDAVGNRTVLQDSKGGLTTSVYDAANRQTSVQFSGNGQTLRADVAYTAINQVQKVTRFSDLAGSSLVGNTSYSYDTSGRLTNIHHYGPTANNLGNYSYTYDLADRLTNAVENSTPISYAYDNTNQVTADNAGTYTYDANGNRTMSGYTTGAGNRLSNDGTWAYTYDLQGNLTKKSKGTSAETWTYGYDNRNQMTWAEQRSTDGGSLLQRSDYVYDVFGDMVQSSVTISGVTTTTRTAYRITNTSPGITSNENEAWADLDGSNNLLQRYIFSNTSSTLIARMSLTGVNWLLTDQLNSVRMVTDASGAVIKSVTYDAYGNIVATTGTGDLGVIRYAGYRWDSATGLFVTHWRWYNPATGRWTTVDPIGFAAGDWNPWRYVKNRPTNATDPSGLEERDNRQRIASAYANSAMQMRQYASQYGYKGPLANPDDVYNEAMATLGIDHYDPNPLYNGFWATGNDVVKATAGAIWALRPRPDKVWDTGNVGYIVPGFDGAADKIAGNIETWERQRESGVSKDEATAGVVLDWIPGAKPLLEANDEQSYGPDIGRQLDREERRERQIQGSVQIGLTIVGAKVIPPLLRKGIDLVGQAGRGLLGRLMPARPKVPVSNPTLPPTAPPPTVPPPTDIPPGFVQIGPDTWIGTIEIEIPPVGRPPNWPSWIRPPLNPPDPFPFSLN